MLQRFAESAERLAKDREIEGELLTPTKAANFIPKIRGRKVSASTIIRWIINGKRGVYLDATRGAGSGWFTSLAAIRRFQSELATVVVPHQTTPKKSGKIFSDTQKDAKALIEAIGKHL